jgi:hypothetical protein
MEHRPDHQDISRPSAGAEVSASLRLPSPGIELEQLLALLTPPGALTWHALPAELPWTRPPGGGRRRPREGQLRDVLTATGVKTKAAQWYVLNGPFTEVMVSSPRELDRNHGRPARAIEVAVEHDIAGSELTDIATRLELTDHLVTTPGRASPTPTGDPRSARRYLRRGRQLLSALGVWPWARVDDWNRTRRWWLDEQVLRELLYWHDRAWMDAAERLAACARVRKGSPSVRALRIEEYEACRAFRSVLADLGDGRTESSPTGGTLG